MAQQTAVEWLVRKLTMEILGEIPLHKWDEIRDAVQQAKEMHRQEIIDAYHTNPLDSKWKNKGFEYYNETYSQ